MLTRMIITQISKAMLSFSVFKNQTVALADLSKSHAPLERRAAFMRLCFSPLASWILFFIFFAVYLNPFRYHMSLVQGLGLQNPFVDILYLGNFNGLVMLTITFAVLSYLLKLEFILLALIGILLAQGDMNVVVAFILFFAVITARSIDLVTTVRKTTQSIRKLWVIYNFINTIVVFVTMATAYWLFNYLNYNGYYAQSVYANRYESYVLLVFLHYTYQLVLLSVWGHFYNRKM